MIDEERLKKCEKFLRFFIGLENFTFGEMHVGEKSMGKSWRFSLLSFITLEIC